MQTENRLFDDLARLASGAMGTLQGMRGEVESVVRAQLERVLAGMDLVSRDEFDAAKAMAAEARAENERLSRRLDALEAALAARDADEAAGRGAPDTNGDGEAAL